MPPTEASKTRLRKHADYQRVYKQGRKQSSQQMSYFYARRAAEPTNADPTAVPATTPRVGLTAGKVLGNAVLRNRIKRRMREAVRKHIALLTGPVDVVLHPRKTVLEIEFSKLEREVARIFANVQAAIERAAATGAVPGSRVPAPQVPRSRTPRDESQPRPKP